MSSPTPPAILFLCTGNSCRSQMAEGWARHLFGQRFAIHSAGVEKHGLNPQAVQVMAEAGIDITGQRDKLISELPDRDFDLIITLCSHADQHCPAFPGRMKRIHQGFDDPPKLPTDKDAPLAGYRRVRDEIKEFVRRLPELLPGPE